MYKVYTAKIYKKLPENDPKVRKPNIELAMKITGWNPKIKLEEGVEEIYKLTSELDWY